MEVKNNFEEYLSKYCRQYGLTTEEAISHRIVEEVRLYYEKLENKEV